MRFLTFLLFLLAPLFYLLLPLSLLAFDPVYYQWTQRALEIPPLEDISLLDSSLARYFLSGAELPAQVRELFQEREFLHLEDIARLLHSLLLLTIIVALSFIAVIGALVFLAPVKARRVFPLSLAFSSALYLVGGTLFALFFEETFLGFHLLVFPNEFWILGEDYLLYQLFPPSFFQLSALPFFALSAFLMLASYLLHVLLRRTLKGKRLPGGFHSAGA